MSKKKAPSIKTLVIDLDGTLVRSDMALELLMLTLRWAPHMVFYVIYLFLTDRAQAKRWMMQRIGDHIDPAHLPYEDEVLALINRHVEKGGTAWLVSGSDHELVGRIADHVGLFSRYQGSRPGHNLTSSRKAAFLVENLPDGFEYAGNSTQDYAVWKKATAGYGFRAPAASYSLTTDEGDPVKVTEMIKRTGFWRPLRKAMRLHQWAKNILVFVVPGLLLASLSGLDFVRLGIGFVCYGCMASGTYLLNDLFDIPDDRKHPTKKLRQIADGRLSVIAAGVSMLVLVGGSLVCAFVLEPMFGVVLATYAVTTIAYSFRLKRLAIVDVFVLAGLFSLRVWGGAEIVHAPPSAWLMMFIGMVFLSLALVKRYVEVTKTKPGQLVSGRGYRADDASAVLAFGAATANGAVISLAVYGLLAPDRLIDNAIVMMFVAGVVAAWFMRIWLVAVRGELNDDPVLFAVKDKVSLLCLLIVAIFLGAESSRDIWSSWF